MTDAQVIALIAARFYVTENCAATRTQAIGEAALFLAEAKKYLEEQWGQSEELP